MSAARGAGRSTRRLALRRPAGWLDARALRRGALGVGALAVALAACAEDPASGSGGAGTSSSAQTGGGGGADGATSSSGATSGNTVTSTSTGTAPCTDASSCDDGNPCTDDTCGVDGRCSASTIDVDDGNPCTIDGCDPVEGPTHVAFVADDGDLCSLDVCDPALGTYFVRDALLFSDDFATEDGGWTYGAPWSIGPAVASTPNAAGMADPAEDASPTDDDGIAGVTIGGSPGGAVSGTFYLESPPIDADVDGLVVLEYQRWLGEFTAHAPTVEVWNGADWIPLWSTPRDVADAPPRGDGWVLSQHDLTTHKNEALRVRFGVTLGTAPTAPSWNLDDVAIYQRGWPVDDDACTIDSCGANGPATTPVALDDGDACTVDICHPKAGVSHAPTGCSAGTDGCCPPGCPADPDCGAGGGAP